MTHDDPPANYPKQRASDGKRQPVNDPMMAVAWTRLYQNEAGKENKILCTTMGAATDLQSEGLRRLIVNGVYWGLGLNIPQSADVTYVGEYKPTMYGFKGYVQDVKPADHAIKKTSSLQLKPNDHIAIIGNALPDRMQHDGYFETLIAAKFPNHNLVIRNLSAAGDEVATWHRSQNFGTRDDWLDKVQANVVFAFYGFNESFKGDAGLPQFKSDLDNFLKGTLAKCRVVLFSPIAADHPKIDNATLRKYADAMESVARGNGVPFVDCFAPTRDKHLTINGMHLSEAGDKYLAPIMFESLFHEPAPAGDFEKLRLAINEKNAQWHARYRTVDGYNVYGGRSQLEFPSTNPTTQITNYHVMQEEMSQRDVLTANRDKRIWATARGEPFAINDNNLPPVTPVPTNKPGPTTNETAHTFLSGEAAIAKMTVHAGCKVNLFASEEQFPDLINPVQMLWDTKGRLWVSAWRNYPERTPTSKIGDKILILEDTDHDGHADRCTTFLDDLNCPTGFQFYKDGVLVMQAPDLWFVRDTTATDRPTGKSASHGHGLRRLASHANSMCHEPGGAIYLSDGVFHRTQVETALGPCATTTPPSIASSRAPEVRNLHRLRLRQPARPRLRLLGQRLVTDATGNNTYFGPAFSGRSTTRKSTQT
jgi:lysophospholipase L1-like esterase